VQESRSVLHKCLSTVCWGFFCVCVCVCVVSLSVTYIDRKWAVCHLKVLDPVTVLHSSSTRQFCALPRYKSSCRLMKIWWINSQLDWTLVIRSDNTFHFYACHNIWYYFGHCRYGYMLENMGLTPVARSYRHYSRHYCKLVFKQDNLRLIPVRKCGSQTQKLTVWT